MRKEWSGHLLDVMLLLQFFLMENSSLSNMVYVK